MTKRFKCDIILIEMLVNKMTLKEFLKLNNNIMCITVGVVNSTSLLKRCDIDEVPQDLMNKKVVGWAVEEGQEIVIEVED